MKKSLKRIVSIMLAVLLLGGVFTVLPITAGAAGETEYDGIILGDVDGDGRVSVVDATLLQRYVSGMIKLSDFALLAADVDGDDEVTILDASWIQRFIGSMSAPEGIGNRAGDENEGIVYQKTVPWYSYDTDKIVKDEAEPVYFSTAYPDVPFVSDEFAIGLFLTQYEYDLEDGEKSVAEEGLKHQFYLPMGTSVEFDYDNKTMLFSDYTTTLTVNGHAPFSPMSPVSPINCKLYQTADTDLYYGGDPILMTFSYNEVPMLSYEGEILIPLQTMTDLFFSYVGLFFQYNGEGIYAIPSSIASIPSMKEYLDQYQNNAVKTDTISSALAQVNYYELCMVLDARYGLQAAHNIASFDDYFRRKGLKNRLLSTDLATVEKAQQDISSLLFEDFHSGNMMQSVFLSEQVKSDTPGSPVFLNRYERMDLIVGERSLALGDELGVDFPNYQRIGDTVFITFDQFSFYSTDYYYSEEYKPTTDGNTFDTVDLFHYALERLKNEDKDVKNVVVDLACNEGGAIYSCAYAMQAICGQSMIIVQNPNTWALHQCVYRFDLNLDGTIDDKDKSMLEMGFNVAVVFSDFSFSCGNLLPIMLDSLSDRVLLLGQQSGGGSCSIGYISTGIGSMMQISGESRFSTMKNGYIRDIDGGISPDIYLSLNRMFDRNYIINILHNQFG